MKKIINILIASILSNPLLLHGAAASSSGAELEPLYIFDSSFQVPPVTTEQKILTGRGSLSFSPNGKILAVASQTFGSTSTVFLWSLDKKKQIKSQNNIIPGNFATFSPNGNLLITATEKGRIYLYKINHTGELLTLDNTIDIAMYSPDDSKYVQSIDCSPDGRLLAVATNSSGIYLIDLNQKKQVDNPLVSYYKRNYRHAPHQTIQSATFNSDGNLLASYAIIGDSRKIQLWNVNEKKQILDTPANITLSSIAFSPTNSKLLALGLNHTNDHTNNYMAALWDVEKQPSTIDKILPDEEEDETTSLAFSPDGKLLAAGSSEGTVRLWDLDQKKEINGPLSIDKKEWSKKVWAIAFNPSAKILAIGCTNGKMYLWRRKPISSLQEMTAMIIRQSEKLTEQTKQTIPPVIQKTWKIGDKGACLSKQFKSLQKEVGYGLD